MDRRDFVKNGVIGMVASSTLAQPISYLINKEEKIKVGLLGVGARGIEHLKLLLHRDDVVITALNDIDEKRIAEGLQLLKDADQPVPMTYTGAEDYHKVVEQKDVDAVIISTPWVWHTPMAVASMEAGVAVACEVAGGFSIDECWRLVNAYERTGTPYFAMENVCYRRDVMAVIQMVRDNLFGEIVHLEGGYQHDLRAVKFNNGKQLYGGGVEFGDKGYSEAVWRTNHSIERNGDIYPTHGLGPVGVMINNNRGNRLVSITSMSSKSRGLHDYIVNHENGGPDHPNASVKFKLGDVVTSMIQCADGESILLTHDTNLPRPYSLGFRVQGTKGLWMDVNKSIYVEGRSESHRWESQDEYMKQYDHPLWRRYEQKAVGAGHGGMDYFVINAFIEALKRDEPMPLDVYDMASWSVVTPLSERSIAQGGAPQAFPDFTSGKWVTRKPIMGFDDRY